MSVNLSLGETSELCTYYGWVATCCMYVREASYALVLRWMRGAAMLYLTWTHPLQVVAQAPGSGAAECTPLLLPSIP